VMRVAFELNGKKVECETQPNRTLLDLIRVDLGVISVKKGCEEGECGSCTVLLDGLPVTSCLVLAAQAEGRAVTTVDGLIDDPVMEALRKAFMEDGAVQCGFCTPGMIMSAKALLDENPSPTEGEVREALQGNLCRCTGYKKIVEAVMSVSGRDG
jgi:carbon-monoxide dehydrogenase small subunit